MEFVDLDKVNHDLSVLVKEWMAFVNPDTTASSTSVVKQPLTSEQQLLGTGE